MQSVLFVVVAIGVYAIVYSIARRIWIAVTVALLAGVNAEQLAYAKSIIIEGFASWVVVAFLLAVVLFFRRPGAKTLWIVAAMLLVTLMTRTEWVYVPSCSSPSW